MTTTTTELDPHMLALSQRTAAAFRADAMTQLSDRDDHTPRYLVVGPGVGSQLARPVASKRNADALAARLNEEYGAGTHHVTGGES